MSSIPVGNSPVYQVAGGVITNQRTEAAGDRQKAEASQRKFNVDQTQFAEHELESQTEAQASADRDADGRLPYGAPEEAPAEDLPATADAQTPPERVRSHDVDEIVGQRLDLDA